MTRERTEEGFGLLADLLLEHLTKKIRSGEASAAEVAQARQLLVDSKIQLVKTNKKVRSLVEALPTEEDDRRTLPFPVTGTDG